MKVYQYAMRAHRETRANYMVCEKTFDCKDEVHLQEPQEIADFLNEYAEASELPNEKTWLFCFDASARLVGFCELTQGDATSALFDVKRTMQLILMTGAVAAAIAHNHPSGSMQPSQADINSTERMIKACSIMDVGLVDHIIVGYKGYFSFAEHGMMH